MERLAMGATTKSISGLFASVCGRNTSAVALCANRLSPVTGPVRRAQGYPSLAQALLRHFSWRTFLPGQDEASDQRGGF